MLEKILHSLHNFKKHIAGRVDLARLPIVSGIRKKVISFARKKVAENVNGYTMYLDDMDTLALSWHHVFEPATTDFFKKNIKRGQTVIDLGANIGYYTLLFSGLTGSEGHVYSFEPDPENAAILRKNLEINSVTNVTVVEKAVDENVNTRRLYLNKSNRGNHQIFDSGDGRDSVEIQTTSLDFYFADQNVKIDWIKMDIEGAELQALRGMKKVLNENPDLLLVTEIFAQGLTGAGTSVQEYVKTLSDLNFKFEEIDERNNRIFPISEYDLIKSFSPARIVHPNIICRGQ